MLRSKWAVLLTFSLGALACMAVTAAPPASKKAKESAADAAGAGDQPKSPLQKIMLDMDNQTKAIQKVSSSNARFKKAGSGADIIPAAEKLVELGDKTRPFTEPAAAVKKPQKNWDEYTDQYVAAAEGMAKAAKKKNFNDIRKAMKALDQSCSNCHGMFRPKTGGDEFGGE